MDQYASYRQISFPQLAQVLGLDISKYKIRNGGEYYGRCPVHDAKTNQTSFSYDNTGRFHCFSCNAKGRGGIDLTMKAKGLGFKAACELLEPLVSSQPQPYSKKEPVEAPVASSEVLEPLKNDTWRKFAVKCEWLEKRIPDAGVREQYGVFCYNNPSRKSAYSGRVMIPVKDFQGTLYGYLGRNTDNNTATEGGNNPKYLFPKNLPKSRFLFGAFELGQRYQLPVKVCYLVESPFCVMKFAQYGLPALSPFGWSIADEQVSILLTLAKGIVYLPDRNKRNEAANTLHKLATQLWLRFPQLPDGCEDPEHLDREQVLAL